MASTEFSLSAPDFSRWIYSSAVMVDRLGKIIERKHACEGLIPKGIFLGLQQRFFQPIINPKSSFDFLDSISLRYVAARALTKSSGALSLDQFDEVMRRFSDFFNSLDEGGFLSFDDLKTAEEMKIFFREIELAGEEQIMIPL